MEIIVGIAVVASAFVVALVLVQRRERERTAQLHATLDNQRQQIEVQAALNAQHLDSAKEIVEVRTLLDRLQQFLSEREARHGESLGQVVAHLQETARQTQELSVTTQSLRETLSSTTARGQWGERMAEDVLRLAGFVEDVNYRKHRALEGSGGIPDYTFLLPQGRSLHMDVKFPFNNYERFRKATSDIERERCRKDFLKDVRARVKELTAREYVDPASGTVDCVLLFVPNEQVYAFIQEHDSALLDEALRSKIVVCSPLTLYAVLAVIRQAVDNFQLEQTSKEILELLIGIERQWDRFVDQMGKVGRNIRTAASAFDELESTRRRQLERQFDKIGDLRRQQALVSGDETEPPSLALEA